MIEPGRDIVGGVHASAVKSALGLVMLGPPAFVAAQSTTTDTSLQEVVVAGIRASLEESLETKRAADSVEDVITAEDIGKMPDKNIADSLQRVPGMTISSAGATEGGFDENDRVSMRGTNPRLTQTLINDHNVAAGDWFVLDSAPTSKLKGNGPAAATRKPPCVKSPFFSALLALKTDTVGRKIALDGARLPRRVRERYIGVRPE